MNHLEHLRYRLLKGRQLNMTAEWFDALLCLLCLLDIEWVSEQMFVWIKYTIRISIFF